MKYLLALLAGFTLTACGASVTTHPRWTADYCSEHRQDYHHAYSRCAESHDEAVCVYSEDWMDNCRRVRQGY